MDHRDAIKMIHGMLTPQLYVEISCRNGASLAMSRSPGIGIDPNLEITSPPLTPTRLFKMTSDEFFARDDVCAVLGAPIDLSFIDCGYRVESALRDFMNLERHASSGSVIVINNLLPERLEDTGHECMQDIMTGDVYRLVLVLKNYRPDLDITTYDVEAKGLGVVSGLNPGSAVLADNYEKIEGEIATGKWMLPIVEAVRNALRPKPADRLRPDLEGLARHRKDMAGNEPAGAAHLYLDLLKRSLLNRIYLDDELRILYLRSCLAGAKVLQPSTLHDIRNAQRKQFKQLADLRELGIFFDGKVQNSGYAHSMMGKARMDNLHASLDVVRLENIAGDLIECGVWRGGGCIFMAGYCRLHGMEDRRIFVADSFDGLPKPSHPQDQSFDLSKEKFPELAVSLQTVQENFAAYDLDRPNVIYLKGWFKDTLPQAPIEQIALLRLDGDLYESTMDALNALYDKVAPGGVVIIDDYNAIAACRQAVTDFFAKRSLSMPELSNIDWTGVYFRKPPGGSFTA